MSFDHPIQIPFILRGQEVTAKDLLYQSRDGTNQFHYPDPRPLLDRIVLSDPTQIQRDFASMRVSEIIDFLAEAGKAMTLNHDRMEQACRFSVPFSATLGLVPTSKDSTSVPCAVRSSMRPAPRRIASVKISTRSSST